MGDQFRDGSCTHQITTLHWKVSAGEPPSLLHASFVDYEKTFYSVDVTSLFMCYGISTKTVNIFQPVIMEGGSCHQYHWQAGRHRCRSNNWPNKSSKSSLPATKDNLGLQGTDSLHPRLIVQHHVRSGVEILWSTVSTTKQLQTFISICWENPTNPTKGSTSLKMNICSGGINNICGKEEKLHKTSCKDWPHAPQVSPGTPSPGIPKVSKNNNDQAISGIKKRRQTLRDWATPRASRKEGSKTWLEEPGQLGWKMNCGHSVHTAHTCDVHKSRCPSDSQGFPRGASYQKMSANWACRWSGLRICFIVSVSHQMQP